MSWLLGLLLSLFRAQPRMNPAGFNLIRQFEGLSLVSYKDSNGQSKIGYGCPLGNLESPIGRFEAEALLLETVKAFEIAVRQLIKVPVNDNQFSALVSFSFNLGIRALLNSTLLKLLNEKNYLAAAGEFLKWDNIDGKASEGLRNRRIAERFLFLSDPRPRA